MCDLVTMETGFASGRLLIKDIGTLVGFGQAPTGRLAGPDMRRMPVLEDAWLAIEDGRVMDGGAMADFPGIADWSGLEVVDANGRCVLPAWVDSHTHLVHAASRESEFVDRIRGLSYQEIAARGGGILNSARVLREMEEEVLFDRSLERMERLMRMGTGALEIESGYGLDMESEMKMLRVARRLGERGHIPVKTTFLGCHAVPDGFGMPWPTRATWSMKSCPPWRRKDSPITWTFSVRRGISAWRRPVCSLKRGAAWGCRPRCMSKFTAMGGVGLCVEHEALSVDHLEVVEAGDVADLASGDTIPVALPLCSLFLDLPYTPGRTLVDAGCALAIATDFNPGSAPSGNLHLAASLGCMRMGLERWRRWRRPQSMAPRPSASIRRWAVWPWGRRRVSS